MLSVEFLVERLSLAATGRAVRQRVLFFLLAAYWLLPAGLWLWAPARGAAEEASRPSLSTQTKPQAAPAEQGQATSQQAKPPAGQPSVPASSTESSADSEAEGLPPEDWAVELLDAIANGSNGDARDALLDAAFAAGPAILPQLQAGLKDDRTAEFAAQSLAYIGGGEALKTLAGLLDDRRDLDLRRFYFAALGEYKAADAGKILLYAVDHADSEPDRTVSEAAILALTVRADTSIIPRLEEAEKKTKDIVIHDDLDNAIAVIETRARFLASPAGAKSGGSVNDAVRTYFLPALEPPPAAEGAAASKPKAEHASPTAATGAPRKPEHVRPKSEPAPAKPVKPETPPGVKVDIQSLTLSPSKERALARVLFETPDAVAYYDLVLQKQGGNWNVASVWLDSEAERQPPKAEAKKEE
jgi:hypothetical protein